VGSEAGVYEWRVYLDNSDAPFYTRATGNLIAGDIDQIGETPHPFYITTSSNVLGQHEVKIGNVTRHFTVANPTPAEISGLTILGNAALTPNTVRLLGLPTFGTVHINGQVRNPGGNTEYYTIRFSRDDHEIEHKEYSVSAGSTVEFTFAFDEYYVGTHHVLIKADGSSSQVTGDYEAISDSAQGVGESGSGLTAGTPLTLSSVILADGIVGELYTSDNIKPTGGKTPYSYSITAGNLPNGLVLESFNDYFRIEGTPIEYGAYEFQVNVNNANETTGVVNVPFKITIIPNLKGIWQFTTTVTQAKGVCAGEGGTSSNQITITQNERKVTFSGFLGDPGKRLTGELVHPKTSSSDNKDWVNDTTEWIVYVTGSYPEDSGITTSTLRLVIDTATALSGGEDWTWTGGGGTCPDGKATIVATRISGP